MWRQRSFAAALFTVAVIAGLAVRAEADSITTPDTDGNLGWESSLVLDAAGNPIVAYYEVNSGDLKVLRCN
ncbi:MAG: hypothetical protein AAF467_21165, partial [Actinomycetota bacterium]